MKILLVQALPAEHLYSRFAHSLATALEELGHEARVSDQSAHVVSGVANPQPLADEIQSRGCDAVISFSSFFGGVTVVGGAALFDALGVKFLGWQLDHPILAPQSLARVLDNRYAVYCNHNHTRFAQAVRLPGRALTLLPGAQAPSAPVKDFGKRELSIFIAATWNGPPERPWDRAPESPGKQLFAGIIERLSKDREASLLEAFNDTSRKLRLAAHLGQDAGFDDKMIEFMRDPLNHFRKLDRIATIKAVVEAGFPITIAGAGWRSYLGDPPNVTYLEDRIDFAAISEFYNNAKIVINLNAGNGACERALYGSMAGAAVVSDYSQQLDQLMGDGTGVSFFNRATPASIVSAVGRLLETDGGEAMADAGRRKVEASGLWLHRAQRAVEFLQGR